MSDRSFLLRLVKAICLVLIMGVSISAYATTSTFTWKEEVLLHDGQKIIVERSDTYDSSMPHEIGQHPPLAEHIMTFTMPSTNRTVIWKSDYRRSSDTDSFHLLALDFLDGVPYVATRPSKCPTYDKWNRPNPPYVFFKYVDGWQPISLSEFPEKFKINVLTSKKKIMAENHTHGFVRAQTVSELNREPGASKELYVLFREPIDLFGICPEPTGPDGRPVKK
jgi:hypothetical protein